MTPHYRACQKLVVRAPLLPVAFFENPFPPPAVALKAVRLASPDLASALDRPDGMSNSRARSRLLRYLIRMSTRTTPFGMFAGVAIAQWSSATSIELSDRVGSLHGQVKAEWLAKTLREFESEGELLAIRVQRSNALLRHGGRIIQSPLPKTPGPSIRSTPVVERALEIAAGPILLGSVLELLLAEFPDAPVPAVTKLLGQLLEKGFLISTLQPSLLAELPERNVMDALAPNPRAAEIRTAIERKLQELAQLPLLPLSAPVPDLPDTDINLTLLLRNDGVSASVRSEVERAAEILLRLGMAANRIPELVEFRSLFKKRYQIGQAVPLLELVDPDFGIAYPPPQSLLNQSRGDARRDRHLRQLVAHSMDSGNAAIALTEEDLKALEQNPEPGPLPVSLDIFFAVAARAAADIDAGDYRLVISPAVGAIGAGRGFGRFARLFGHAGLAFIQAIVEAEEQARPDALFADVTHAPETTAAAIASAPSVRRHAIPFGVPAPPNAETIAPEHLCIRLEGSAFVIRHRGNGRRVLPAVGHMLNTRLTPSAVRFLLDVYRDSAASLAHFNWGGLGGMPFLPRVEIGRIVLAPARWRILASDLADSRQIEQIRSRRGLPNYVCIGDGDRRLMADLRNPSHRDELASLARSSDSPEITLSEAIPSPDQMWLDGPGGKRAAEFIASLIASPNIRPPKEDAPVPVEALAPVPPLARSRPAGSEWLYLKLYVSPMLLEDVLIQDVAPAVDRLVKDEAVSYWFFVRYSDPDTHLRIRLQIAAPNLLPSVFETINGVVSRLLGQTRCSRASFETYDREVERYGGIDRIEVAERAFAADTQVAIGLLRGLQSDPIPDRFELGVLSINALLHDLGRDGQDRLSWLADPSVDRSRSGELYRRYKQNLRGHLQITPKCIEPLFQSRSKDYRAVMEGIQGHERRVEIERSHVHMSCNRLFPQNSAEEGMALSILERAWRGLLRPRG